MKFIPSNMEYITISKLGGKCKSDVNSKLADK